MPFCRAMRPVVASFGRGWRVQLKNLLSTWGRNRRHHTHVLKMTTISPHSNNNDVRQISSPRAHSGFHVPPECLNCPSSAPNVKRPAASTGAPAATVVGRRRAVAIISSSKSRFCSGTGPSAVCSASSTATAASTSSATPLVVQCALTCSNSCCCQLERTKLVTIERSSLSPISTKQVVCTTGNRLASSP